MSSHIDSSPMSAHIWAIQCCIWSHMWALICEHLPYSHMNILALIICEHSYTNTYIIGLLFIEKRSYMSVRIWVLICEYIHMIIYKREKCSYVSIFMFTYEHWNAHIWVSSMITYGPYMIIYEHISNVHIWTFVRIGDLYSAAEKK